MLLAEVARARRDPVLATGALERANELDPTQSAPLRLLWRLARDARDEARELDVLARLVPLEQHEPDLHRRWLELLVAAGRHAEAVRSGPSALFADMEGARTHVAYARALAAVGRRADARFELESALLCPDRPEHLAAAHRAYADLLEQAGERARAEQQRERARALGSEGTPPPPSPAPPAP
jgi:hypothetical protein